MGVDPGLTRCGLGIVDGDLGKPLRMIAVGVIRTPTSDDPAMRLLALQIEIDEWMARYEPDAVAVERVFKPVPLPRRQAHNAPSTRRSRSAAPTASWPGHRMSECESPRRRSFAAACPDRRRRCRGRTGLGRGRHP